MLLLFIDSLLLILLTTSLGILVLNGLQRLFRLRCNRTVGTFCRSYRLDDLF